MNTLTNIIETPDGEIVVLGDTHVDPEWLHDILAKIARTGVKHVYHVGDFGFGLYETPEEEERVMNSISAYLTLHNMKLIVTLGNHDNWLRFLKLAVNEYGMAEPWTNIYMVPRGFRFTIDGVSFLSMGGAASINFEMLKEGIDWWSEETITMGDMYRLGDETAEVVIAHDAPFETCALREQLTKMDDKWSEEALRYAESSQRTLSALVEKVRPEVFFHGHYHVDYVSNEKVGGHSYTSVGLNKNGNLNNAVIFNVKNKEIVRWI